MRKSSKAVQNTQEKKVRMCWDAAVAGAVLLSGVENWYGKDFKVSRNPYTFTTDNAKVIGLYESLYAGCWQFNGLKGTGEANVVPLFASFANGTHCYRVLAGLRGPEELIYMFHAANAVYAKFKNDGSINTPILPPNKCEVTNFDANPVAKIIVDKDQMTEALQLDDDWLGCIANPLAPPADQTRFPYLYAGHSAGAMGVYVYTQCQHILRDAHGMGKSVPEATYMYGSPPVGPRDFEGIMPRKYPGAVFFLKDDISGMVDFVPHLFTNWPFAGTNHFDVYKVSLQPGAKLVLATAKDKLPIPNPWETKEMVAYMGKTLGKNSGGLLGAHSLCTYIKGFVNTGQYYTGIPGEGLRTVWECEKGEKEGKAFKKVLDETWDVILGS